MIFILFQFLSDIKMKLKYKIKYTQKNPITKHIKQ